MENNVETYFTVLRAKGKKNNMIESQISFELPSIYEKVSLSTDLTESFPLRDIRVCIYLATKRGGGVNFLEVSPCLREPWNDQTFSHERVEKLDI